MLPPKHDPLAAEPTTGLVVGFGDLLVSADTTKRIVTYGLGSGLSVVIHDPVAGVGGMLHATLPSARVDPTEGRGHPARYLDTGLPFLFREAYALGAVRSRLVLKMAGAGRPLRQGERHDSLQVGRRNVLMARQVLWRNGLMVHGEDLGGARTRTVALDLADGTVRVISGGNEYEI